MFPRYLAIAYKSRSKRSFLRREAPTAVGSTASTHLLELAARPPTMAGPADQAGLFDLLDDILLRIAAHLLLQERLRLSGGCRHRKTPV